MAAQSLHIRLLAFACVIAGLLCSDAQARAEEAKRDAPGGESRADDDQKEEAAKPKTAAEALKRQVPTLRFDRKPFREAVGELAKACETTIHIDSATLEAAEAKLDTPVSVMAAEGQTGEVVLTDILKQVQVPDDERKAIDYGAWADVVVISTRVQTRVNSVYMERPLPEVAFTGVSLADALQFVQDLTGQRILVDWTRLETAGVTRDSGVTVNLRNTPMAAALRAILDATGAKEPLQFLLDRGKIVVTRRDQIGETLKDRKSLVPPGAQPDGEGGDGL